MANIDLLRFAIYHTVGRLLSLGLLTLEEFTPGMGLDEIKAEYADTLYGAMANYLESGSKPVTAFRNEVRRAVQDGFTLAFYAGYADAGGSGELPPEAIDWLNGRIETEVGFADGLFQDLKALRADGEKTQGEKLDWCRARSEGYTSSLNGVYAYGQAAGDENKIVTFTGEDGKESCPDCQRMKGQSHTLKWWKERDLIPYPGNPNYECGNYEHCHHYLEDEQGNVIAGNAE